MRTAQRNSIAMFPFGKARFIQAAPEFS